jgi:hypothetical protein
MVKTFAPILATCEEIPELMPAELDSTAKMIEAPIMMPTMVSALLVLRASSALTANVR